VSLLCLALWAAVAQASPAGIAEGLTAGDRAFSEGDIAAALVAWSEAAAQARAEGARAEELDLDLRIAAALRGQGRLESAGRLLDRVDELAATPEEEARLAVARGQWLQASGELPQAERELARAFDAAREAAAPTVALNAAVALGDARRDLGDAGGAERAFDAARTLAEALGDRLGIADADHRLGLLAHHGGDLKAAKQRLEAAVEGYRVAGAVDGESDAQAALAGVLDELGRPADAAALLSAALQAARARRDLPRQAGVLLLLGGLSGRSGQLDLARQQLAAARDAFDAAGMPGPAAGAALDLALLGGDPAAIADARDRAIAAGDHRREARADLDLAITLQDDDPRRARKLAEDALRIASARADFELDWRARALLGRLDLAEGHSRRGIARLQAAIDRVERSRLALDPTAAAAVARRAAPAYAALVDALLAAGDQQQAFLYAWRLQLAELPPGGDAAGGSPQVELQRLAAREAALGRALGVATDRDPAQSEALRARLSALELEFSQAVDQLRATHSDLDALTALRPEDLEAVRRDLPPGVVVLQPVLLPARIALMAVRAEGLFVVSVPRTVGAVEDPLRLIGTAMRLPGMIDPARVQAAADALGALLIAPVRDQLADAEVLLVARTGSLRALPFAMLRDQGRWLVEQHPVVSVTDLRSLSGPGRVSEDRVSEDRVSEDRVWEDRVWEDRAATRPLLTGPDLLLVGNPDGSLPGAEAEVRHIAELLPGATVVIGAAGTEQTLRQRAVGKQALHLATHGLLDPDRPTASRLVLAPSPDDPDGSLSYGEIPGLGPYLDQARLVVLSACESALPLEAPAGRTSAAEQQGATGGPPPLTSIAGLAAQFRRAGVDSIVGSLWKVDDAGTGRLMGELYRQLAAGSDLGHAMQRAQLAMLAEDDWSDPFYWAAFEVFGDWW